MTTQVEAGYVYAGDDDDVAMVGFADHQYDTKSYVLLQRDKNPSAEDRAAGEHKVHITVDDQSRAAYGAILGATLGNDTMTLVVDERHAAQLRTDQEIVIRFPSASLAPAELAAKLRELFEQEPGVFRIADE